ncbi:MAG: DinB family protein [Bacteroidia bacterium]|jgi:hypothetical protein|nr:DinB family protein [Bacteroidia bacterium]
MNDTFPQLSTQLLSQLKPIINELTDESYCKPLPLLSGNTLAKHIRHVLELYEELVNGYTNGVINYDARKRNVLLEQNRTYTLQFIYDLSSKLSEVNQDKTLVVYAVFDKVDCKLQSSVFREMAYNIEHAIHHMAIIKMCILQYYPHIQLPTQFGVAFSTQAYLNQYVHP